MGCGDAAGGGDVHGMSDANGGVDHRGHDRCDPGAVRGGDRLHGEIGPTERLRLDDDRAHGAGGDGPTEVVDRSRRLVDGHRDRRLRTDCGDLVDAGRWFLADRDVERR